MRISQKDIAQALGVSLITVNRALNNSGYVSPELKSRIFAYAKQKAYVPHRASQILVRNKTRSIAVFTQTMPEYFWDEIWKGAANAGEYIKSLNYEVTYHRIPDYDTDFFLKLLRKEIQKGLDAAILPCTPIFNMKEITDLLNRRDIPYLFCNVDNAALDRICYVGPDYPAGGRLAANFIGSALSLKEAGTTLVINVIEDPTRLSHGQDINLKRLEGFLAVMEAYYPAINNQVEYIRFPSKLGVDAQIQGLLKKNEGRVNAIYFIPAYNDMFLNNLKHYGYGDTITVLHDVSGMVIPSLRSGLLTAMVYQDPVLQGYTAVKILEHLLESKCRLRQQDIDITHTLIFRENIDFLKSSYLEFPGGH